MKKLLTTFTVFFFILNPETIELALFISAIGVDIYLLLMLAQLKTDLDNSLSLFQVQTRFNRITIQIYLSSSRADLPVILLVCAYLISTVI